MAGRDSRPIPAEQPARLFRAPFHRSAARRPSREPQRDRGNAAEERSRPLACCGRWRANLSPTYWCAESTPIPEPAGLSQLGPHRARKKHRHRSRGVRPGANRRATLSRRKPRSRGRDTRMDRLVCGTHGNADAVGTSDGPGRRERGTAARHRADRPSAHPRDRRKLRTISQAPLRLSPTEISMPKIDACFWLSIEQLRPFRRESGRTQ